LVLGEHCFIFGRREKQSFASYSHPLGALSPHSEFWRFGCRVNSRVLANFEARDIKSEFSEAKFIGLAVFCMCQALVTGIPIVALV
jgi:hypothetical protein